MKCSYCNYENSQSAKFCSGCGNPLVYDNNETNTQSVNTAEKACELDNPSRACIYTPPAEDRANMNFQVAENQNEKTEYENKDYTRMMQPPTPGENTYSADRFNDAYRSAAPPRPIIRAKKKKSATLKVLLISLVTVIVCSITFLLLYFCTDVFGKNCKICDREFDSQGQYCEECVKKYTCIGCGKVNKNVTEGICKDCIDDFTCTECGEIDTKINKSLCTSCAEEYTCKNCGEIDFSIEEGYCQECTEKHICKECGAFEEELEEGFCSDCILLYTCKDCKIFDENMEDNYCDECRENHICKECSNIDDELISGYCSDCAENGEEDSCFYCGRQINTLTSYKDKDGYYYCDNCNTGYYCYSCKAPVKKGETLCNYCE